MSRSECSVPDYCGGGGVPPVAVIQSSSRHSVQDSGGRSIGVLSVIWRSRMVGDLDPRRARLANGEQRLPLPSHLRAALLDRRDKQSDERRETKDQRPVDDASVLPGDADQGRRRA